MIPGNTTMSLNQAAMIEAVQMYLESKFKDGAAPIVKSVTPSGTSRHHSSDDEFTVQLSNEK